MDAHTLDRLEFDRVRQMLAEHTHCALGRKMALKLRPVAREPLVREWLTQVVEMKAAFEAIGPPPFGGLHDVRDMVHRAVPPAKLEPEELAELADSLNAACAVFAWAHKLPEACVTLRGLVERLGDFRVIAEQITRVIDPRGRVRDDASPRLARIRGLIDESRLRIKAVIDRLLRSSHVTRWLRYPEATFHNDRLVLPLSVEHRGRVPGIIHRTSDSGATLFVEPAEAVELNNTIIRLRHEEDEEIGRILWQLTHLIHLNAPELLRTMDALAVLDLVSAKVKFAAVYEMTCPQTGPDVSLKLRRARHPLLLWLAAQDRAQGAAPREVVPIDVRLGDDFDVLVVTGPNTGGKTVALKTIGLIVAMTQAGMPIPADEGSTVPLYDDVRIDVGDEQSLQQSLSTFSAHLTQLLRSLAQATSHTLVLVDELGAGTDPDEGAAIGQAVVEELLRIGCHAMVTTHLGVLKSVAFTQPRADNAAVEFDVASLRPTYRLLIGEPGNSNALAIAERLGMPKRMVESACRHLSDTGRRLNKAIAGTLVVRREAERARDQAETARLDADRARRALEEQRDALQRREAEFADWTRAIARLRPGDAVHVRRFDRPGQIVRVQLHKQTALVSVGAVELEVPLSEIHVPPTSGT